jgi:uncharacterized protein (UPF0210 family)
MIERRIGIRIIRERVEFPPLEILDSLCEQQAKKEEQFIKLDEKVKQNLEVINKLDRVIGEVMKKWYPTR